MKKNPENEKKIASLISEMTLEEKVLQMFQISNVAEYPEGTYEKFVEAGAGSFLHPCWLSTAAIAISCRS